MAEIWVGGTADFVIFATRAAIAEADVWRSWIRDVAEELVSPRRDWNCWAEEVWVVEEWLLVWVGRLS